MAMSNPTFSFLFLRRGGSPRSRLLPWAVLLAGLAATLGFWRQDLVRDRARVAGVRQIQADEAAELIQRRLAGLSRVLRGAAGFLSRGTLADRLEWRRYVADLDLQRDLPGVLGLTFAPWVRAEDRAAFERSVRAQGFLDYRIVAGGPLTDPDGCSPILYSEPSYERERMPFGADMWADPVRREAMIVARDTGLPALTGQARLYQGAAQTSMAGMLFYAPVYGGPRPPETLAERRKVLRGWVLCPIRLADWFPATLADWLGRCRIQVVDSGGRSPVPLYDSEGGSPGGGGLPAMERQVEQGARSWTLRVWLSPHYLSMLGLGWHWGVLAVGGLGSLLLAGLVDSLVGARARAEAAAEAKMAELMACETQFQNLFEWAPLGMAIEEAATGRLLSVNSCLARILGYPAGDLLERTFQSLAHPEDGPGDPGTAQGPLAGAAAEGRKEQRYLHRDGRVVWGRLSSTRLPRVGGGPERVLRLVEDVTRERLTAEAAASAAAFNASVLDALPASVAVLDAQGVVVQVNRSWAESGRDSPGRPDAAGLERGGNYLGTVQADRCPTCRTLKQGVLEVMAGIRPGYVQESSCGSPEGQPRWFQITVAPIPGHAGCLIQELDITRVVRVEERLRTSEAELRDSERLLRVAEDHGQALRQAEERFRMITQGLRDYLEIIDHAGRVAFRNRVPAGTALADVVGEPFARGLDPEFAARAQSALEACRWTGEETLARGPGVRLDGSPGWFELHLLPVPGVEPAEAVLALAQDRTEAKLAESALKESEARLRGVVEHLRAAILIHDLEGRFLFVNAAATRSTGYSREELLGMGVGDLVASFEPERDGWAWRELKSGQRLVLHDRYRRKDGTVVPIEIHLALLGMGEFRTILAVVREPGRAGRRFRLSRQRATSHGLPR